MRLLVFTVWWFLFAFANGCAEETPGRAATSNRTLISTSEGAPETRSFVAPEDEPRRGFGDIEQFSTDVFAFEARSVVAHLVDGLFTLEVTDAVVELAAERDCLVIEPGAQPLTVRLAVILEYNDFGSEFASAAEEEDDGWPGAGWAVERDLYGSNQGLTAHLLQSDGESAGVGSLRFLGDLPRQAGDPFEAHLVVEFGETSFVETQLETVIAPPYCD